MTLESLIIIAGAEGSYQAFAARPTLMKTVLKQSMYFYNYFMRLESYSTMQERFQGEYICELRLLTYHKQKYSLSV